MYANYSCNRKFWKYFDYPVPLAHTQLQKVLFLTIFIYNIKNNPCNNKFKIVPRKARKNYSYCQ